MWTENPQDYYIQGGRWTRKPGNDREFFVNREFV